MAVVTITITDIAPKKVGVNITNRPPVTDDNSVTMAHRILAGILEHLHTTGTVTTDILQRALAAEAGRNMPDDANP